MENEGNQLILNKPEELLLAELRDLKNKNLTEREASHLTYLKQNFIQCYKYLAYKFFGLSPEQIKSLEPEKRLVLANILFTRAKPMSRFLVAAIPLMICVPVIGWIACGLNFADENATNSFRYRRRMTQLKKMLGDSDWFPHQSLGAM